MLIWTGPGIAVAVILTIAVLGAQAAGNALAADSPALRAGIFLATLAAAAAVVHFMAKALARGPSRTLIDKDTGQEITIGPNAGSFFFIPMRYWPVLFIVFGVSGAYGIFIGAI